MFVILLEAALAVCINAMSTNSIIDYVYTLRSSKFSPPQLNKSIPLAEQYYIGVVGQLLFVACCSVKLIGSVVEKILMSSTLAAGLVQL